MSFPQYPSYIDSGVEWLGEMPTHWTYARLRWLGRRFSGGTPDRANQDFWVDGTVPWLNSGAVNQSLITEPSEYITEAGLQGSSAKWVPSGALVVALAGQGKTKGMVAQLAISATCNITNGLDPNAPMKDSGVEWLGGVPAHWETRRLSSITIKITNGYVGPTRDILVDSGVRYLQSLHIKGNHICFDTPYYVRQDWSDAHGKSILQAGDVLIVQTGDIGQAAVVPEEFAGCNCHALIILAPERSALSGKWLSWVLNSSYGFHNLLSIRTGALHPHLNCGDVKDLFIPLPPVSEQSKIIAFITERLAEFDELISETESAVILLQERRSALISAAVTGKIDVRGRVAEAKAPKKVAAA